MDKMFENKVAVVTSGVQGISLAGRVRVNSILPGRIDTNYTVYEGPDAIQQPAGRVRNLKDIYPYCRYCDG